MNEGSEGSNKDMSKLLRVIVVDVIVFVTLAFTFGWLDIAFGTCVRNDVYLSV